MNSESVGIWKICKAEINSHTTIFFFLKPVRINTCQSLYKSTFTVVDISCCAKNYILHIFDHMR